MACQVPLCVLFGGCGAGRQEGWEERALIELKPHTEVPIVIEGLVHLEGHNTPAFQVLKEIWEREHEDLDIHPRITESDLEAFFSMMHALEAPVLVPFTREDLWYVHGVFDQFRKFVRPQCPVSYGIMGILTKGVASLSAPPY